MGIDPLVNGDLVSGRAHEAASLKDTSVDERSAIATHAGDLGRVQQRPELRPLLHLRLLKWGI